VMGLWLLESCRREWQAAGLALDYSAMLASVDAVPGCAGLVCPDHPRFFNPSSMTSEVRSTLAETGQHAPADPVLLTKVILDSLALRYASVIATIERLTSRSIEGVHIVGGGAHNWYLNQATADATRRPVLAGPVEAAAAGNLLVQAIACEDVASLAEGRSMLMARMRLQAFTPRRRDAWIEAATRYEEIEAGCAA